MTVPGYDFVMAGKEGQDGGAAEWLEALSATLMREIDRAAEQLKEAKLEKGDLVAAERHARTIGAIALAARRTFALTVELAQMRAAASGDNGEDMDDIQGEDDPVEMERLKALAPVAGLARPRWEAGRRRLVWESGTVAYAFSAEDPDSLRGPQFHGAWADEFCAWRKPEAVLATLRMGLRLGDDPKLAVTTTPRPHPALKRLLAQVGTCAARGATADNADHLSPGFLEHLNALYGGTRLKAQELDGLVVESDGALFRAEDLARTRGSRPVEFERVIVAVDPPATAAGDACGIVVAGRREDRAYVLADRSVRDRSPLGWGEVVADAAREFDADAVVAEINQGGDMVRTILVQAGCEAPVKSVYATRGKRARAEPVAALYEQGRVTHCGAFPALEEELMALGAVEAGLSPDRADALVWAVTHLLLDRPGGRPSVRRL